MEARLAPMPANVDRDKGRMQLCAICLGAETAGEATETGGVVGNYKEKGKHGASLSCSRQGGVCGPGGGDLPDDGNGDVRAMDRKPSLETPMIRLAVEAPISLCSESSPISNMEFEGMVGVSVVTISERGR